MFKRILVPCDGSAHASEALTKAVELQKLTGAELLLLTVYRHYSHLEATFSMVRREAPKAMDDAMREYAEDIARQTKERAVGLGAANPRAFVNISCRCQRVISTGCVAVNARSKPAPSTCRTRPATSPVYG